jgi:hypothetical protein
VFELSNGDFTSGLELPLAAEIDKRPLLTSQKTPIPSDRYTVDKKHVLNTNRKTVVDKSIGSVISGL